MLAYCHDLKTCQRTQGAILVSHGNQMNVMRCVIIVEELETNQTASALVRTEVQLTIKCCPQVLLLNDLTTNSLKLYSNLKTKLLYSKLKKKDSKSKLEGMGRIAGGSKALLSRRSLLMQAWALSWDS